MWSKWFCASLWFWYSDMTHSSHLKFLCWNTKKLETAASVWGGDVGWVLTFSVIINQWNESRILTVSALVIKNQEWVIKIWFYMIYILKSFLENQFRNCLWTWHVFGWSRNLNTRQMKLHHHIDEKNPVCSLIRIIAHNRLLCPEILKQ